MSNNRHNISETIGGDHPFAGDASALDLGRVLDTMGALAPELAADVVTEELRLAQYHRVHALARWITGAADSLITDLEHEINRQKGNG